MRTRDNVEQVYRRVREAILEGEIAPGTVMSQVALSDELGVSRTPLREALRMLQSEGLVDARTNRRATVKPISATDLEELVVMRVALETEAIRLSADRLGPKDIAALEGRLAEMTHFAAAKELRALADAAQRVPPRADRARRRARERDAGPALRPPLPDGVRRARAARAGLRAGAAAADARGRSWPSEAPAPLRSRAAACAAVPAPTWASRTRRRRASARPSRSHRGRARGHTRIAPEVDAPQGGEGQGDGMLAVIALPAVGALLGLVAGFRLLGSLPGRDAVGTALVLLVATAAGLAAGLLLSVVVSLWRARRRRPKPAPVAASEPRRARGRPPEPEPAPPPPEPPVPASEPELPPPADPVPGWHPDPAGGPDRRYWDGEAWTDHRWRPRKG